MPYTDPEKREDYRKSYYQRMKNDPHFKAVRRRNKLKYNKRHKEELAKKRRKYEKENPDKVRRWNRKAQRNKRLRIIEWLGGKCVGCGIKDMRVLQVDHINGDGAEHRRKHPNQNRVKEDIYQMLRDNRDEALKRYQLLCANCNFIKFHENKEYQRNR